MEELALVIRDCRNCSCWVPVVEDAYHHFDKLLNAELDHAHRCSLHPAMVCAGGSWVPLREGSFLRIQEIARGSPHLGGDRTGVEDDGIPGNEI